MVLLDSDFENLSNCPWDGENTEDAELMYIDPMGCEVVRCLECGLVYARRRLNNDGLKKYWSSYYSRVQTADEIMNDKRNKMYDIDFQYINSFVSAGQVLDVGCGDGSFMSCFERSGYETCGVEFGKEAARVGEKKHTIYYGVFPDIKIKSKFDLITFRGVLQYLPDVKLYLNKAISLLKEGGMVYITAQPNMNSLCFNLFKDKFTQPVSGADFCGYNENIISKYMSDSGLRKVGEKYFYEETPYADVYDDIKKVYRALSCKQKGEEISFSSPPFWGNMMSLVYEKMKII